MDTKSAISSVSEVLEEQDSDLYVFQPADVEEKFFIEGAVISAAATVLLSAFLKGVKSKLEDRMEGFGKKVTDWAIDKLEQLFRSTPDEISEADLQKTANDARVAIDNSDESDVSAAVEDTEKKLKALLEQRGILEQRAEEITRQVQKMAIVLTRST